MYTDGASKNNPGIAGIGYVLLKENTVVKEAGYKLPQQATNNLAEMLAILVGLEECLQLITTSSLLIKSDSLLLVNQFNGIYKIKNIAIAQAHKIFNERYKKLIITFQHISRNCNTRADMLANKGIHEDIILPLIYQKLFDSLLISK
jgi:ribonuclease HI